MADFAIAVATVALIPETMESTAAAASPNATPSPLARPAALLPVGVAGLGDAELTGVLRGWRRMGSWAAAMEHAAAAELVFAAPG